MGRDDDVRHGVALADPLALAEADALAVGDGSGDGLGVRVIRPPSPRKKAFANTAMKKSATTTTNTLVHGSST
jgi:hypothetical protein